MRKMRVLQALLISLAIHFLLVIFISKMPVPPAHSNNVVEIELQPKPSNQVSQNEIAHKVVHAAELAERLKAAESTDPLKFLSDRTQRVKEQTRAALSGLTKNRTGQKAPTEASSPMAPAVGQKISPQLSDKNSALEAFSPKLKRQPLPGRNYQIDEGSSTLSSAIDDRVRIGSITALNTDRYLFYSFYARVEELVYFRWSSAVEQAQPQVAARLGRGSGNSRWLTQLEIWLKPNGEFHSSHIMKESGVPEFDRAAVLAFRQAGLFPNPPKELVEEDGLIRLKYGLTVYFDPKVLAGP